MDSFRACHRALHVSRRARELVELLELVEPVDGFRPMSPFPFPHIPHIPCWSCWVRSHRSHQAQHIRIQAHSGTWHTTSCKQRPVWEVCDPEACTLPRTFKARDGGYFWWLFRIPKDLLHIYIHITIYITILLYISQGQHVSKCWYVTNRFSSYPSVWLRKRERERCRFAHTCQGGTTSPLKGCRTSRRLDFTPAQAQLAQVETFLCETMLGPAIPLILGEKPTSVYVYV